MLSRRPIWTIAIATLVFAGILAAGDYHRANSPRPNSSMTARTASDQTSAQSATAGSGIVWATSPVERAFTGVTPPPPLLTGIQTATGGDYDRITFDFTGPKPPGYRAGYVPQAINEDSGQPVTLNGPVVLQLTFSPASNHDSAGKLTFIPSPGLVMPNLPGLKSYLVNGNFENHMSFALGLSAQNGFHISEVHPTATTWTIVVDVRH